MQPYLDDIHETDCPGCGAALAIEIVKQDGHNEPEECHCPKCGHEMRFRASQTPTVRLR